MGERFTLKDVQWPNLEEACRCEGHEVIKVEQIDEGIKIEFRAEGDFTVPYDVMDGHDDTAAVVTRLVIDSIILELALDVVPELHEKITKAVQLIAK